MGIGKEIGNSGIGRKWEWE